jgi:hypothetical protein
MRQASWSLAAVMVCLPAGCARAHKSAAPQAAITVPQTEFAIRVTNHNYLDVVLYVLHDGLQTRVGTVTGSSAQTFYLSSRLLSHSGEIRLYGDPIGNDEYALTDVLVVEPGQYIDWTLETDLRRSSAAVF